MEFRTALPDDLDAIMAIVADAKESLRERGIDQWQRGYPNAEIIGMDIARGVGRLCCVDGKAAAYGALIFDGEPAYRAISHGAWLSNGPYAVIHRLCTSAGFVRRGLATEFVRSSFADIAAAGYPSLRMDTHPQNEYMKSMLAGLGFVYCGDVVIESRRMAYEKLLR